jgi:ribonuclease PH
LDLDYIEDVDASVDMNVVLTGRGRFVEVQGSGEEATFSQEELDALVRLARAGVEKLRERQRAALGTDWPFGK